MWVLKQVWVVELWLLTRIIRSYRVDLKLSKFRLVLSEQWVLLLARLVSKMLIGTGTVGCREHVRCLFIEVVLAALLLETWMVLRVMVESIVRGYHCIEVVTLLVL